MVLGSDDEDARAFRRSLLGYILPLAHAGAASCRMIHVFSPRLCVSCTALDTVAFHNGRETDR